MLTHSLFGTKSGNFLCQQCEHFFYEITFTFKSSDTSWQALFTFVCVNESRRVNLLFSTFSLNLISFFRLAMKWPYLKWAKCVLPLGNKKGKLVELSYHENFLHQRILHLHLNCNQRIVHSNIIPLNFIYTLSYIF